MTQITEKFIFETDESEWSSRLHHFESATTEIVNESEERISKQIAASEDRMISREKEMQKYLEGLVDKALAKKKTSDEDSSSHESDSDSDFEISRSDIL